MLYYLDTCIVIYAVEGQDPFQQRACNHLAALESAGHRFVISDLTKQECLSKPWEARDRALQARYTEFFADTILRTIGLTLAIHERAALIRSRYWYANKKGYSHSDALHLAAAIEFGCDAFLTNDNELTDFPEIKVEVLP